MTHDYGLVFHNTATDKKAILEHYTSRKKAEARAKAWNELKDTNVTVTVKIIK